VNTAGTSEIRAPQNLICALWPDGFLMKNLPPDDPKNLGALLSWEIGTRQYGSK
jgi:hypothetical protein